MFPVLLFAMVLLMLATSSRALGFVRGVATELELGPIGGGFQMRRDAAEAFLGMSQAAQADGVALVVDSAFRTNEEQLLLHAKYLNGEGNLAAEPGYSNHQGGIAVDIDTRGGTNRAFTWLTTNAARFNFRRTVANEPWHWEYRP